MSQTFIYRCEQLWFLFEPWHQGIKFLLCPFQWRLWDSVNNLIIWRHCSHSHCQFTTCQLVQATVSPDSMPTFPWQFVTVQLPACPALLYCLCSHKMTWVLAWRGAYKCEAATKLKSLLCSTSIHCHCQQWKINTPFSKWR